MKRISLIIIASVFFGLAGNAQELKFGHIDTEALIQALPEFDTASARLERFHRELTNALEIMQVELNNKAYEYERDAANLSDLVRQTKEQELMDMNRRIQEFQQSASQQLQERQAEYFQPIWSNVERTIREVGRENGFVYIFIIGQGSSLIYFDEARSTDIMPLAKAKLGIR